MFWEELTGNQFAGAVSAAEGVCVLPLSVLERHSHHLPLATDMYIGREVCRRAVALEPAIVFPNFIFTQILEAQHCAGTIAIDAPLILSLLDNVCREIARNGMKKIAIYSAHGGNWNMAPFFAQMQLASPRDYVVYVVTPRPTPEEEAMLTAHWATGIGDHAGETETSAILAIRPDLVHMDQVAQHDEGAPLNRLKPLRDQGVYTGIWWYGDHPTHYAGDARPATAEKGELYLNVMAQALARGLRAIKADTEAKRLQDAFYAATQHNPA